MEGRKLGPIHPPTMVKVQAKTARKMENIVLSLLCHSMEVTAAVKNRTYDEEQRPLRKSSIFSL